MPRFPRTEPEIAALALLVTEGLAQMLEDFPTPPVAPDQMQARHANLEPVCDAVVVGPTTSSAISERSTHFRTC